jgi:hypothetical protein
MAVVLGSQQRNLTHPKFLIKARWLTFQGRKENVKGCHEIFIAALLNLRMT